MKTNPELKDSKVPTGWSPAVGSSPHRWSGFQALRNGEDPEGQRHAPSASNGPCPPGGYSVTQVSATHRTAAAAPAIFPYSRRASSYVTESLQHLADTFDALCECT